MFRASASSVLHLWLSFTPARSSLRLYYTLVLLIDSSRRSIHDFSSLSCFNIYSIQNPSSLWSTDDRSIYYLNLVYHLQTSPDLHNIYYHWTNLIMCAGIISIVTCSFQFAKFGRRRSIFGTTSHWQTRYPPTRYFRCGF